jgi:hypothetical protein
MHRWASLLRLGNGYFIILTEAKSTVSVTLLPLQSHKKIVSVTLLPLQRRKQFELVTSLPLLTVNNSVTRVTLL